MSFIHVNSMNSQTDSSKNGNGDAQQAQGQEPPEQVLVAVWLCAIIPRHGVGMNPPPPRSSLHFLMIQPSICSLNTACRWCSWNRRWQIVSPATRAWFSRPGWCIVSCAAPHLPPRCRTRLKPPGRAAWVAEETLWRRSGAPGKAGTGYRSHQPVAPRSRVGDSAEPLQPRLRSPESRPADIWAGRARRAGHAKSGTQVRFHCSPVF